MENFDPFNDRTARDIRNSLSEALVGHLSHQAGSSFEQTAAKWLERVSQTVYHDYIHNCLKRYRRVALKISDRNLRDSRLQALELWNARLFFEMHELLETVWHHAHGAERTGLKGLIQAAGVYVHQSRGNLKAARGLARRARTNLAAGMQTLCFVDNMDTLMRHLEVASAPPPELIAKDCE